MPLMEEQSKLLGITLAFMLPLTSSLSSLLHFYLAVRGDAWQW